MKKYFFVTFIVSMFYLVACAGGAAKQSEPSPTTTSSIMVYYFHGAQRCTTCRAIETETRRVLETNYPKQMKEGKVVLKIIDISKSENQPLVNKYEVAWSSLIIDDGSTVVNLTNDGFSYARNEPQVFERKVTETINKMLR